VSVCNTVHRYQLRFVTADCLQESADHPQSMVYLLAVEGEIEGELVAHDHGFSPPPLPPVGVFRDQRNKNANRLSFAEIRGQSHFFLFPFAFFST
jgi:hypothetical protein